ncbi:MAG: DUF2283 domain-containing protein [bacterium]
MDGKLTFRYVPESDILVISRCPSYPAQETEELGDDVIARLNPTTNEIESVEVLSFTKRLHGGSLLTIPLFAELKMAS